MKTDKTVQCFNHFNKYKGSVSVFASLRLECIQRSNRLKATEQCQLGTSLLHLQLPRQVHGRIHIQQSSDRSGINQILAIDCTPLYNHSQQY